MADDAISVELTAKVDQLKEGLAEGTAAVKEAVDSIKGSLGGIGGGAEKTESEMTQMLAAVREGFAQLHEDLHKVDEDAKESETWLKRLFTVEAVRGAMEAYEFFKRRLEGIKEAFEGTVGYAEEFGLSNAKIAAVMGTNEEQAAGLSAALANVGSSTDAYESMALHLEQTLHSAGGASKELKDQFKDANGHFLSGAALMDRLQEVTNSYAEGADRTAVTVALLGRRAKDYYDIARVTPEAVQAQIDIYKEFGVNVENLSEASRKLEDAEGNLRTAWSAEKIVVGQDLMPIMQSFFEYMSGDGKSILQSVEVAVKALMSAFAALKTLVVEAVIGITGTLDILWESVKTGGKILYDVLTGNFSDIQKDWDKGAQGVKDAWATMGRATKSELKDLDKQLDSLWDKQEKRAGVAEKQGAPGKKAPTHLTASEDKPGKKDNSGEEEIQSAEKIALARIQIEEQTYAHLLAMGQESTDAFIAQETHVENERYNVERDGLLKRMALPQSTLAERSKLYDQLQLLDVQHEGKLEKIEQDGEKRRAEIAKVSLASFLQADDEKLKSGIAAIEKRAAEEQMSADERYRLEVALTQQIRQEELARLDAESATLTKGTKAYFDATKERAKVAAKFDEDIVKAQDKLRKETETSTKEWVKSISDHFKSGINSMIFDGKSFEDAMAGLAKNVAQGFVDMAEQIAEKWLETQITNQVVAEAGSKATATPQIVASAAVAAAAAFADSASLGPIGLAAAPGAATGAFAAVMAWEGALASAAGGMTLDRDQLVYAHAKEMVLPAHLSQGIQNLIASGGSSSSQGGDTSLHYAPTIHSNQKGLAQLLQEDSSAMVAWLAQATRDGKLKSRGP